MVLITISHEDFTKVVIYKRMRSSPKTTAPCLPTSEAGGLRRDQQRTEGQGDVGRKLGEGGGLEASEENVSRRPNAAGLPKLRTEKGLLDLATQRSSVTLLEQFRFSSVGRYLNGVGLKRLEGEKSIKKREFLRNLP